MPWARLDDNMPHHPKTMEAGVDAFGFDCAGICYCNRYGTDGFIADSALSAVFPPAKAPKKLAQRLVQVGRWKRDDERGGYAIHDFLDYNPSADEVRDRREVRARAGRLGGLRSGESRRGKGEGNNEAHASADALAPGSPVLEAKVNPDPIPIPDPIDLSKEDPQTALTQRLVGASKKNGKRVQEMARAIVGHGLSRLDPREVERIVVWAEKQNPDTPAAVWEPLRRRVVEVMANPLPEKWNDRANTKCNEEPYSTMDAKSYVAELDGEDW